MDWSTPLRSQQADFIQRLKSFPDRLRRDRTPNPNRDRPHLPKYRIV